MGKTHYLYLVTRNDGEQYIGVSSELSKRMYAHKKGYGNKNLAGRDFSYSILVEGEESFIYSIEEEYIKKYKCSLNVAKGGNAGPQLKGESHGNALLSEIEVLAIKALLIESDLTYTQIADMYKVSKSTISNIANNRTWTNTGRFIEGKRKPNKINDTDKKKVIDLWNEGYPRSEIVKITGVKKTSVHTITKDITPLNKTRHANALSPDAIMLIRATYSLSRDIKATADTLEMSKETIKKYVKDL